MIETVFSVLNVALSSLGVFSVIVGGVLVWEGAMNQLSDTDTIVGCGILTSGLVLVLVNLL